MPLFKYHVFQFRILCYLKVGQCFGKTAADTYLGGKTNVPNTFHLFMNVYISSSFIYMHFNFFTFQIPYMLPLLGRNSFPTRYIIYHYKQGADYFSFLIDIIMRTIALKCGCGYFSYAFSLP